jgi:hypothetical protein
VSLPREAEWRADFITEMANFPVGVHDDITDAFCHAMKAFTTARDFRSPDLTVSPGRLLSAEAARREQLLEQLEYEDHHSICNDLDQFDRDHGNW